MEYRAYRKRFWGIHGLLALLVGLFGLSVWVRGRLPFSFVCPSVTLLGLYCPVCGGTRSVLALLRGEVLHSFFCFPPILALLFLAIVWEAKAILSLVTKNLRYARSIRLRSLWILLGILVIHFAARNLLLGFGYDYLGDIL